MTTTKQLVVLTTTSLLAFAAGAAVGVLYTKSKLGDEFDARLADEVAQAKRFYSRLHKREDNDMPTIVETPEMLPIERDAAQAMSRYQGSSIVMEDIPEIEFATVNAHTGEAFENNAFDSQPDMGVAEYEELIRNRTEEAPYIITLAEFMNNELEFEQDKLVYFKGDGILVDPQDEVIDDPDALVGDDNLVKFGHFSGDARTLYVRNEITQNDFHITLHDGSYAYVVHGIEPTTVNAGD